MKHIDVKDWNISKDQIKMQTATCLSNDFSSWDISNVQNISDIIK